MVKVIKIVLFCFTYGILNGCDSDSLILRSNLSDTTVLKNEIRINYRCKTDTLNEPKILSVSTVTITQNMLDSPEFRILKKSIHKYDSLNFINCVASEKYIPIRFFTIDRNILESSIYLPTQEGRFYFGKISVNAGDLIIRKGNYKILEGYQYGPAESRMKFQIFIPSNASIKRIVFQCD